MGDPTGTTGNCFNKILIEPFFEWKKNLKAMRNNTERLNVVKNRLEAAIEKVKREMDAAKSMPKGQALPVPKTVVDWLDYVEMLKKKVDHVLGKVRRPYPAGATASAEPSHAWTLSRVKLKYARTQAWVKYAPWYANKVVKYEKEVKDYLDSSEETTKATTGQLLQAPEGMSSLQKEMEELERVRDDIAEVLHGSKYLVDLQYQLRDELRAWHNDIGDMGAEFGETKKEYSNMVDSSEIHSDWLFAFNEKTGKLVTKAADLKRRGVDLKVKAEKHGAYLDDVETKMKELRIARALVIVREKTIKDAVEDAKSNLLVPRRDVLQWLKSVGQAKSKFEEADADFQKLAGSNGNGSTLERWRELLDKVTEIRKFHLDSLLAESVAYEHPGVVDHARQHRPIQEPLENVVGQKKYLQKAKDAIKAAGVGIIGIYGDGGVGKSTLLSAIHSDPGITGDFEFVIKIDTTTLGVPMSSDMSLTKEKIQEAMIEMLPFLRGTKYMKREMIWNALQGRRFLILIDNIWGTLDLTEIGVPRPSVDGKNNNSKVIFTTRFENVANEMGADRKIKVTCLNKEDARELFKHAVGEDTLKLHGEIPDLAKQIADRCQGLPLALKLIGTAMRNESSLERWNYVLKTLEGHGEIFDAVDKLYSRLALSYHLLPSETLRQCFLYCSLFPDNYLIPSKRELITSWMGEEFFDKCRSVEDARREGSYIIDNLKRACLVEVEIKYNEEFVKMHDVVRGMARWIVSNDEKGKGKFVVDTSATPTGQELDSSSGLGFVHSDSMDWPEDVQRVYVGGSTTHGFTHLKLGPKNCNKLSTLIFYNSKLERFEDGCFASMPNLRVLNLSMAGIVDLRIGEEKELGQLRFLRLWHTDCLRQLPEVGLAKLKILLVNNPEWKGNSQIGGVIKRLLPQLWVLSMYDPTLESMQLDIAELTLESVQLEIAELEKASNLQELSIAIQKQSNLKALAGSVKLAKCVVGLTVRVDYKNTAGVFNLLGEVGKLNKLRELNIRGCSSLNQIIVEDCVADTPAADNDQVANPLILVSLERLYIGFNTRLCLVRVGHRLPSRALENLRALIVHNCSSLAILTFGSLAHTLEHLELSSCIALVKILHIGWEGEGSLVFQKLKVIQLRSLPYLTAICNDTDGFSFPSLEKLHIDFCPNLKRLPPAINSSILAGIVGVYNDDDVLLKRSSTFSI